MSHMRVLQLLRKAADKVTAMIERFEEVKGN